MTARLGLGRPEGVQGTAVHSSPDQWAEAALNAFWAKGVSLTTSAHFSKVYPTFSNWTAPSW